jgi:hypothetical protein
MTTPAPTPATISGFEASPTATRTSTGEVLLLDPKQYASVPGAMAVIGWLTKDPRTSGFGPFTLREVDQSNPWWKYSCPLRLIKIGVGMGEFDAALWYATLASKQEGQIQSLVNEMAAYASGQYVSADF